ncbi:hypothetical protein TPA0906_14780 [Streptomyces olivaceus]|uniref:hypothetical protein n=1 Tax=Streptomyces olivaceus TaxID=47716 RepID=UPI0022EE7839|nr:hypothetical protein [Streptomyces olivaceus]GHI99612.1 hypothetical protein TPA0906_14780 [Streptomyces olivaceus]
MACTQNNRLPDPGTARRVIGDSLKEFGPRFATQAAEHAGALAEFLEHRRLRRSTREAVDLLVRIRDWGSNASVMMVPFYVLRDPGDSACHHKIVEAVWPIAKVLDQTGRGYSWLTEASASELTPIVNDLHKGLVAFVRSPGSFPQPALPEQHPPEFARLHEHALAETVVERILAVVAECAWLYEGAGAGNWASVSQGLASAGDFASPLSQFLTREVGSRYETATNGFEHVEMLALGGAGRWETEFERRHREETAEGIAPRIHAAYAVIAVNYLAEVLERMPKYAEDSGQGKRRDAVTVYGNVGAIHSEVNNSHLAVAHTITSIDATTKTVQDRGQADVAAAIRALAEAVQQDPGIAEDLRAQLLDHVADVADGAVAPEEPRRISRARAAMAAISTAAGTSSQLAQAVGDWHGVLGDLF